MPNTDTESALLFGYLTVVEDVGVGAVGGLLILNQRGQPLEFHCTAPVATNRAQEILFGPTLRSYLLGEQIGRTLVERCKLKPSLLVIDDAELAIAAGDTPALLAANSAGTQWRKLDECNSPVWRREQEAANIDSLAAELTAAVSLTEPFGRIREAIAEAQRISHPTNDEAPQRDAA